ncbi:MAG: Wadjet anti-phage system protein JetD domain-containing protein, partial [Rhodothermales bacterium]
FREHLPATMTWLSEHPQRMLPYLSEYQDLLKVCMYFKDHPRPDCYIRELPIEVHTKFIETHTGILKPLLEAILPEEAIDNTATRFTLRFGLRDAEALVRLRPLSAQVRQELELPYQELALPVVHFADLDFSGRTIVIIENLMTYLTWPAHCGDLAIFGKGFQAGLLKHNQSLSAATLLYWGDLDAQGFMILSQLRASFPGARSFLMDLQTYDTYAQFVVEGKPCTAAELPGLTDEEAMLFDQLRRENRRLEQEHLPLRYVKQRYGGNRI